jgi:nitric oxide dioxygenase
METEMTPEQVAVVQTSFAKVAPVADQAAQIFYDRLFEVAPQVRSLFPEDMREQRRKLMATLAIVVNGLDKLETILPAASALAKRHISYGAQPGHYPVVGEALLWNLGARARGWLDRRRRGGLGRSLHDALQFHDHRGLRQAAGRRMNVALRAAPRGTPEG